MLMTQRLQHNEDNLTLTAQHWASHAEYSAHALLICLPKESQRKFTRGTRDNLLYCALNFIITVLPQNTHRPPKVGLNASNYKEASCHTC